MFLLYCPPHLEHRRRQLPEAAILRRLHQHLGPIVLHALEVTVRAAFFRRPIRAKGLGILVSFPV